MLSYHVRIGVRHGRRLTTDVPVRYTAARRSTVREEILVYKNFRDGLSILVGLGFIALFVMFITGSMEYDRERYSPWPPLLAGLVLVAVGAWSFARRRSAKRVGG